MCALALDESNRNLCAKAVPEVFGDGIWNWEVKMWLTFLWQNYPVELRQERKA